MLDKILNLFPVQILSQLEKAIVANLQNRCKSTLGLGENSCYMGLEIKVVPCTRLNYWYWDWFVYDGRGVEVIQNGCATTENDAIVKAMKWVDSFLDDEYSTSK